MAKIIEIEIIADLNLSVKRKTLLFLLSFFLYFYFFYNVFSKCLNFGPEIVYISCVCVPHFSQRVSKIELSNFYLLKTFYTHKVYNIYERSPLFLVVTGK